jgi:hypothetical protein
MMTPVIADWVISMGHCAKDPLDGPGASGEELSVEIPWTGCIIEEGKGGMTCVPKGANGKGVGPPDVGTDMAVEGPGYV